MQLKKVTRKNRERLFEKINAALKTHPTRISLYSHVYDHFTLIPGKDIDFSRRSPNANLSVIVDYGNKKSSGIVESYEMGFDISTEEFKINYGDKVLVKGRTIYIVSYYNQRYPNHKKHFRCTTVIVPAVASPMHVFNEHVLQDEPDWAKTGGFLI